jgi:hypothetical protein
LLLFGSVTNAARGLPLSASAVTWQIPSGPDWVTVSATVVVVFYPAAILQPHGSARKSVSSGRPWPACNTTLRTEDCFFLSESRNGRMPAAAERAAGFDFQRDEIPTLFEDEIHFVTGAVAPEMELAPERVRRAPGLQRLEQGLFQPEAGVGTGLGLRRCLDGGQGRRMGVVEYRSGRETNHFHAVECNRSSQFAAR